jgi:preprotein translocase subunit SecY
MAKEGEDGRKRINKITRYVTVALAALQSIAYYVMMRNMGAVNYTIAGSGAFAGLFAAVVIVSCFMAGAMLVMWLGERIDERARNGISMMLFAVSFRSDRTWSTRCLGTSRWDPVLLLYVRLSCDLPGVMGESSL